MIKTEDIENIFDDINQDDDLSEIEKKMVDLFKNSVDKKAVLGMDIVGYSKYNLEKQILIPYIFHELYNQTCSHVLNAEPFFFKNLEKNEDFKNNFIDSGDGGFQFFDNPLQALIFTIYFQLNLKKFNTYKINYKLRHFVNKVNLRFTITFDDFYKIENNFYGTSIINCARILSKDSLDRFLIDENTYDWFDYHLNGIENLMNLDISDLSKIEIFKDYNKNSETTIIADRKQNFFPFISSDVQKIGNIQSKNSTISVYNYHAQVMLHSGNHLEGGLFSKFTCTIGNLNLSGITD